VHDAAGFSQSRPEVLEQLRIYTDWLLAQGEDALKQEALGLELNPFQREALARQTLEEVVDAWLSFVGERNTRIVRLRLGLQGEPQTLEEIGRQLGLTRERIRQLQGKSFRILQHHLRVKVVAPLRLLLQEVLAEAGGVMTSERLARALAHAVPPGAVDPAAVIRLIAEAGSFSGWNDELGVWVHPNHDLAHVRQIWEALRDLLSEYPLGLSRTELIQRLRERQAPGGQGSAWDDAFISVCLRTCPGLRHDPRTGDWYLKGRVRPRTRQIALALRRIGRPAHFREIAAEVNAHLGPGKAMASNSVRARLNSEPQYFAWVGKRGTYGLTEWGLTDLPKRGRGVVRAQSRAILATLRAHRRPMSLEELTSEANWRLPSHQHLTPEAARAILESETVRFTAVGDMYNLTEWAKEGRDSGTSRTPGADAGQGLSQAIGQILEMAGCALTAEQIAAQLPLLGLSPCLEEVVVALGRREFRALGDGRYCLEREIEIAEPSRGYRDEQGTLWGAAGPWTRASKSDADTGEWR
jgi:DNA-binding CsgD family transcriptional regulator